jgi:hypothetical protein
MRRKRANHRPASYVFRIANESRVDPTQCLLQNLLVLTRLQASLRKILQQAMDNEGRFRGPPVGYCHVRGERIGKKIRQRVMGAEIRLVPWRGHIEQAFRDRLRSEKGQAFEQAAPGGCQLLHRRRPGGGEANIMVIGHEISIEPVQHFGAVFLPEFEIAGETGGASPQSHKLLVSDWAEPGKRGCGLSPGRRPWADLGLAVLGRGGPAAFFSHPALIAPQVRGEG